MVNITQINATITWSTDQVANASVYWGESPLLTNNEQRASLLTEHSLLLEGLVAGQRYSYFVRSCTIGGCTDSPIREFYSSVPGQACAYRYEARGNNWVDGMIGPGDVVVLECPLPASLGERLDVTVLMRIGRYSDSALFTTPRLLYEDPTQVWP